jgi:hypothetical protein
MLSQGSSIQGLQRRPAAKLIELVRALCMINQSSGRRGIPSKIKKGSQKGMVPIVLRQTTAPITVAATGSIRIRSARNELGR